MPVRPPHDCQPPPNWPEEIQYLNKPRLSPSFASSLIPLLYDHDRPRSKYQPSSTPHPSSVQIKLIATAGHPAKGQRGLFARQKIPGGVLIIPYLGINHHTLIPVDGSSPQHDSHTDSDYDLSLLRLSASDSRIPFPEGQHHVSIGVDAASAGNAARFVNDYRGVADSPNAEFRVGRGEAGDLRMEIWSLKCGVNKGAEVLVSYGKSWWGART